MMSLSSIRLIPTLCVLITLYFGYHTIQGNLGVRRMGQIKKEIALAEKIANETRIERDLLAAKARALSPQSLDLDQLEEEAARTLNMTNTKALVIF